MRPQARPFSIEVKNRNRTMRVASFTPAESGTGLIPPDHTPERDAREDTPEASIQSEARREAETLFQQLNRPEPSEPQGTSTSPPDAASQRETPRRILPDLLAAARDEERGAVQQEPEKRVTKARTGNRRKPKPVSIRTPEPLPTVPELTPPTLSSDVHAERAMAQARRTKRGSKLLPGQRWKERRLPRICWDR